MKKVMLKRKQSQEFAVKGTRDMDLWDDADGEVDDKWQTMMQQVLHGTSKTMPETTKKEKATKYSRKRIALRRA